MVVAKKNQFNMNDPLDVALKQMLAKGEMRTVSDIQEKLKDSFGRVIQAMLEIEMTEHLGHEKYEYGEEEKTNYRNGHFDN